MVLIMPYKDKARQKEAVKEWRKKNRDSYRNYTNKWIRDQTRILREEIYELLGNKCNNPKCPIPINKMDKRGLQIDHVYSNGKEDRKRGYSYTYLRKIRDQIKEGSKDYQLLCAYCNWLKRWEAKEISFYDA